MVQTLSAQLREQKETICELVSDLGNAQAIVDKVNKKWHKREAELVKRLEVNNNAIETYIRLFGNDEGNHAKFFVAPTESDKPILTPNQDTILFRTFCKSVDSKSAKSSRSDGKIPVRLATSSP